MSRQIVDASLVPAPKQRNTESEGDLEGQRCQIPDSGPLSNISSLISKTGSGFSSAPSAWPMPKRG